MINRKKIAGIALMAISGLTLSVSATLSTASADPATTGTQVVTEELCAWQIIGAPSSITLEPAVPGTEYEGDAVQVSDAFAEADTAELNVYSSGNVTTGSRTTYGNCTFYSAPTRPVVTMSIGDADFTAMAESGADSSMDFEATTGNEFNVDQTSSCDAKWTTADLNLKSEALSGVIMSILTLADVDSRVTGTGTDRCKADFEIKINIPGGQTPTYPGQTYTWSGPGFTTALTTSNS